MHVLAAKNGICWRFWPANILIFSCLFFKESTADSEVRRNSRAQKQPQQPQQQQQQLQQLQQQAGYNYRYIYMKKGYY
jgi:hypothetical protein